MDSSQRQDKALFLQPTVQAISKVLGLPSCIWLVDEATKAFQVAAAAELSQKYINTVTLPLEEMSVATEVLKTGNTIIVENIATDERWRYKSEALEMGWKSAVVAPLWLKRKISGILDLYVPEGITFNFDKKMSIIECFASQISATLRQVQGLETLNEVASLISVVKDLDSDLFERILYAVQKVLDCRHVSIFLADKDGNLKLEASSTPEIKRTRFKPGEGLAGHVAQTKKLLLVPDVRKHPQFIPGLSTDVEERSMLLSPILFQSKCIGVISANIDELNGFDEYDLRLMETLRSQIAIAIHNVRLFQSEQERLEEVETLQQIQQIINSHIDLEQVVGAVLDELHNVVEFNTASVQLIRGDYRFLIGAKGFLTKNSSSRLLRNVSDDPLIHKIIQSQEIFVLSDVKDEPLWDHIPETASVQSWIGAPLIVGDQVTGLLTIDHPETGYYTQEDGQRVAGFANQVSAAIYRSDFFQLIRNQAQALTELNKLTYRLLSIEKTHDIRELLQKLAESAKDVLQADVIELYEYRRNQDTFNLPPISVGEKYKSSLAQNVYKEDTVFKLVHWEKPLYAENSQAESILSSPHSTRLKDRPPERFSVREKIQSTAVVPLRTGNESMGLMFASYRTPQVFSKGSQEIIELFAAQAAIAIKNIRFYEELSKNHSLLRRLIDTSPDHIYVKDRESRFLIANEAVVRTMKVPKMEDLIGKTDFDFQPPKIAAQHYVDEQEIFKSGRPIINRGEPGRKPDTGAPIWLLTTKVPFYDNQSNLVGLVGINRDITELKQMEEALRESERKLADIINFLPDATFAINERGEVIAWNHAIEAMTGIKSEDILGKGNYEYAIPFYGERRPILIDLVLKRDKEFEKKYDRLEIQDETLAAEKYLSRLKIHVYGKASPLYDPECNAVGAILTIRDITDRKRAEERLKKLYQLGQKLTGSIKLTENQILQLVYDSASEMIDTSNMYIALYNEMSDEIRFPLVFRNSKRIHVATRKAKNGDIEELIRTKTPIPQSTKTQAGHKNNVPGEMVLSWIGALMTVRERVSGVIAIYNMEKEDAYSEGDLEILQSMSDLAAIALNLEKATRCIAETQHILTWSMISADFVHRMNNLAGTIPVWVDMIRDEITKQETQKSKVKEYLDYIIKDSEGLLHAAEQLKTPPQKTNIDIATILRNMLHQLRIQYNKEIQTGQIKIQEEIRSDLHKVYGLSPSLTNAIFYVISNGIEAILSEKSGILTVNADNYKDNQNTEWVKIDINNTGKGIPEEDRDELFTLHFTTKGAGRGYGLWRARNVIEDIGGNINVSFEDRETTFTILLLKTSRRE